MTSNFHQCVFRAHFDIWPIERRIPNFQLRTLFETSKSLWQCLIMIKYEASSRRKWKKTFHRVAWGTLSAVMVNRMTLRAKIDPRSCYDCSIKLRLVKTYTGWQHQCHSKWSQDDVRLCKGANHICLRYIDISYTTHNSRSPGSHVIVYRMFLGSPHPKANIWAGSSGAISFVKHIAGVIPMG